MGEVHGPGYPAPLRPDIYHPPGWGKWHSPEKKECRAQPHDFFGLFLSILGNKCLIFKDRSLGNKDFLVKGDRTLHVSPRDKDRCVEVHMSYPHGVGRTFGEKVE